MAFAIDRLNAAVGQDADVPPCRSIPTRLDARAIYKTLLGLGIQLPTENIQSLAASGRRLDIKQIDAALDNAGISFVERLRFKHSLTANGLLSRGRPVSLPRVSEKPARWSDNFK